jgi:hypothetical protein
MPTFPTTYAGQQAAALHKQTTTGYTPQASSGPSYKSNPVNTRPVLTPTDEQIAIENRLTAGAFTKEIEERAKSEVNFNEDKFKSDLRSELNALTLDQLKQRVGHISTKHTLSGFKKGLSRAISGRSNNNAKSELEPLVQEYINNESINEKNRLVSAKIQEIKASLTQAEKQQLADELKYKSYDRGWAPHQGMYIWSTYPRDYVANSYSEGGKRRMKRKTQKKRKSKTHRRR